MHLFLVRHGECLGQCDPGQYANPDSCLSELGYKQAELVASRLKTEAITHIVSSPLLRALETAQTIAGVCEIPRTAVWLELREGFSGAYRGRSRSDLAQRFPLLTLPEKVTGEGWEHGDDTYETFWGRARSAIGRLRAEFSAEDRVAVITHGGLANYLLHVLIGISDARPTWFELANASLTHVRIVPHPKAERPDWPLYPPVEIEVLAVNDTAHLVEGRRQE